MRGRAAGWLAAALVAGAAATAVAGEPVRLIFDTDICGDCDDVLALGMIHALQTRGDCQLLAVTVSADNDLAAPFVDCVNTFYGRPDIPIGVVGPGGVKIDSEFLDLAERKDEGQHRYPHDLMSAKDAPDAVKLLRRTLAAQPDGSVTIAQVGFSTNLARLLESGPDESSPLSGLDLVKQKVKLLSLMAGAFQPIDGNKAYREYNVERDIRSAQVVATKWPTPLVWSGFEIGIALEYPSESILRDYDYVAHHPVAEAYIERNPPPHNRPTWDLTSVLYAVYPDRKYFEMSGRGTTHVDDKGVTVFHHPDPHIYSDPEFRHQYLVLGEGQGGRVKEALVLLSSEPPASVAAAVGAAKGGAKAP